MLLNGNLVKERTKDDPFGNASTRIAILASDDKTAITTAYLAVLTRAPSDEEWEAFWEDFYNRTERSLGWFALTLGAVVLGGYGLFEFAAAIFKTSELPWFVKGGIFVLCCGVLLLLVSVIRERLYVRRRTRYDDVKR